MRYFNRHFDGIMRFFHAEGARIENNEMETALKISVRDRKNAMFHKTLSGASIGDVLTSLIVTAADACVNVFEYFNALQRYSEGVKANPEKFLPWNYQETLLEMEGVKIDSEVIL